MAIEGLDNLIAKLNSLKGNTENAVKRGMGKGLARIQASAKQNCPTDTGRLRASIVTDVQSDGDVVIGAVGTNVEYAPYVEFGTGQMGDQSVEHRQDWKGQSAQPFLFPAYRENIDAACQDIKDAVSEEIRKNGG